MQTLNIPTTTPPKCSLENPTWKVTRVCLPSKGAAFAYQSYTTQYKDATDTDWQCVAVCRLLDGFGWMKFPPVGGAGFLRGLMARYSGANYGSYYTDMERTLLVYHEDYNEKEKALELFSAYVYFWKTWNG